MTYEDEGYEQLIENKNIIGFIEMLNNPNGQAGLALRKNIYRERKHLSETSLPFYEIMYYVL